MRQALLLLGLLACSGKTPTEESPVSEANAVTETIEETTVGDLLGTRVGMGNMIHDEYTLPDGTKAEGLVCALALPDGPVWVGRGSEVTVDGRRWRVTGIDKDPGANGEVTLQLLD